MAAMPFAGLLGVEVVAAAPEEVRARLEWDGSRCTAGGILHGGALMGLADCAGGLCAFLNLPDGATGTATIESKTNFFRPVSSGHVDAAAPVLHAGRSTVVVETDLRDADAGRAARLAPGHRRLWKKRHTIGTPQPCPFRTRPGTVPVCLAWTGVGEKPQRRHRFGGGGGRAGP